MAEHGWLVKVTVSESPERSGLYVVAVENPREAAALVQRRLKREEHEVAAVQRVTKARLAAARLVDRDFVRAIDA